MSRGDFVDFDIANEDDVLEEFLGLPRRNAKVEFVNTGAVANEVGQFAAGKLKTDEMVMFKYFLSLMLIDLSFRNPNVMVRMKTKVVQIWKKQTISIKVMK